MAEIIESTATIPGIIMYMIPRDIHLGTGLTAMLRGFGTEHEQDMAILHFRRKMVAMDDTWNRDFNGGNKTSWNKNNICHQSAQCC